MIDDDIYVYDDVKKVPVLVGQLGVGRRIGTRGFETNESILHSTFKNLINIGVWNISGLQNKLDDVSSDVDSDSFNTFIQAFDILCFIETWAHTLKQFTINGYKCYDVIRKKNM